MNAYAGLLRMTSMNPSILVSGWMQILSRHIYSIQCDAFDLVLKWLLNKGQKPCLNQYLRAALFRLQVKEKFTACQR